MDREDQQHKYTPLPMTKGKNLVHKTDGNEPQKPRLAIKIGSTAVVKVAASPRLGV